MALTKTKSVSLGRPIHIYEGTIDLASVAATDGVEQDLTISGLATTDIPICFYATDAFIDLGVGNVRVSAANTLTVEFINPTAGAIDKAGTVNYRLVVIQGV